MKQYNCNASKDIQFGELNWLKLESFGKRV